MRGVNKVIIVGNLGTDPEHKKFDNGGSITNISVATSEAWNDRQTGERKEQTEWHRVVLSNRLGEVAAQYLRKGSKVYIEGSLRTRKWQDQNGQDRYTTEIRANSMQMLDSRGEQAGGGYQQNQQQYNPQTAQPMNNGYGNQGMQQAAPQPMQQMQQPMQQPVQPMQPATAPVSTPVADDDLPF